MERERRKGRETELEIEWEGDREEEERGRRGRGRNKETGGIDRHIEKRGKGEIGGKRKKEGVRIKEKGSFKIPLKYRSVVCKDNWMLYSAFIVLKHHTS